jgi:hypothetical protein
MCIIRQPAVVRTLIPSLIVKVFVSLSSVLDDNHPIMGIYTSVQYLIPMHFNTTFLHLKYKYARL